MLYTLRHINKMLSKSEIITLLLNFFELSAAATGFFFWRKIKGTAWALFPLFLLIIFITEILAKFMRLEGWHRELITPLYKFVNIPLTVFCIIYFLSRQLRKPYNSILLLLSMIAFTAVLLSEIFIFSGNDFSLGSPSYIIGCVLMLVAALISFYNLLYGDRIMNYKSRLDFWVSVGVLCYYIPSLPFNAIRNKLLVSHYSTGIKIWYITMGFDCLMYACFIIGFILFDRNKFLEHDQ